MPPRRRTLVLALCLLFLGLARARAITVRITEADGARVQVSLYPGDVLRVDLPAEPAAAGRQWSLSGHAPAQLETLAATQRVFGGRLSNQGTSSFAWRAVSAGEAELNLHYGPASSRTTHPERIVRVQLIVSAEPLRPESPAPDALSQIEQVGSYMRSQPCADCTVLEERLSLYRAPRDAVFLLRRTYRDAPGGTLTILATGLWSTSNGTADPTATIYQLVGADVAYLLRADGDRLVPLDPQQIPLPTEPGADSAFHKVAEP